jgi:hypothetical protein
MMPGGRRWLLGRAATVGGHVLAEKLRRPVARHRGDVPRHGLDLTPEWLTDVLCREVPEARVVAVDRHGGSRGTTTRVGLRVAYNDAGRAAGLPTELFVKTATSWSQRMLLGGAHILHGETNFFLTVRPMVDIEAPRGYWAAVDDRSWRAVTLMEDIAVTKGARFIEPATPLTRDQVEDLVVNLALLHGTLWESPVLGGLTTPADHLRNISSFLDFPSRVSVGLQRAEDVVPPALHGKGEQVWEGAVRGLELAATGMPRTFLHGDAHVGQTYVTAGGRMGLTDWQACQQGGWGYDYTFMVGSSCEPDDRRAWEHDLLELYLDRLAEAGGKPPGFDEAWLVYRRQLPYPLSAWAFTIGRAAHQPKMHPPATCRAMIKRLATAVDDLDSLAALGVT